MPGTQLPVEKPASPDERDIAMVSDWELFRDVAFPQ